MALIAHYPLNGGTEDYSGYGNDGVSTGAVVSNTGKIGGSYKFDGITSGVNIPSTNFSGMEVYSMTAWVKPLGNHKNYNGVVISSGNWNSSAWNFGLSQDNSKIDVASNSYNRYLNYPVSVGEWTHIVCVAENNVTKVYVNGNYVGQVSTTSKLASNAANTYIGRETYAGGHFSFNGELNDIRIYDHALSDKEVKELAKAKVLHYKFDEHEESTENLLVDGGVRNWSIGNLVGSHSYTFLNERGDVTITSTVAGSFRITVPLSKLNNGKEYSISYDLETTKGTLTMSDWCDMPLYNRKIVWERHSATGVSAEYNNVYRFIDFNISTGAEVTLRNIQLEEKDHATPFTPTSRLALVKDSSGFGNDGTVAVATAPSWSEDSPVGRGSMEFSGGKFITLPNMLGSDEQITVCAWFKANGAGGSGYHIIMGGTEVELDVTSAGQARFGLIVNNVRQVHNYSSGLADGKYHHICGVYDGAIKSIYVDGVLVGSFPVVGKIKNNFIRRVGVFGTGTNYHANGNISDVRIYATALSPEDILELYQTRASIDNLGNLFVQEIDEINNSSKEVDSRGIARFKEFNEVGRPVRYIRDWLNGSTSNTSNHWVEIQAIDPSGTNVAKGKTSPSALITDGSTASNPYYSGGSGLSSVTVDLGTAHDITYLHIWHYWSDKRTYHSTKTEVSTDGTNWVTVFDSAVEGEYAESSEGKKILLYPDKVSFGSDGNIYTNEILEN